MFELLILVLASFGAFKVFRFWKEHSQREQALKMMKVAHKTGNTSFAPPPELFAKSEKKGGHGKSLLIALACLLYCLSPVDILPEAFLGPLGLPDDILVGITGLRALFKKG